MSKDRLRHIFTVDPNEPRAAWLFTLLLGGLAVGLMLWGFGQQPPFEWVVIPFALLVAVAESVPVMLPRAEQSVSVSFAIGYATIVLIDPTWAALSVSFGILLANLGQGKRANIWLFNGAQIFIASFIAATFWHAARTALPVDASLLHQAPALLFTAVILVAVNIVLTTVSVSLAYQLRWSDVISANVKWAIPNVVVLWTVGLLIVFLFRSDAGLVGVLLLWLPLLVVRYSFQQYVQLKHAHMETIQSLAAALDAKDPYTHGHSQRVADLSLKIARELGLSAPELEAVHYAGILHDIGKIGVDDGVLNKPGKLTEEDWTKIRSHPIIGADIVKNVRFLRGVDAIIRHHHESFDGSGYPDGLKGEEIPLGARILCVADAFDAMTTERVYRTAFSMEQAVAELQSKAGQQFDPRVVAAFVDRVVPQLQISEEPGNDGPPREGHPA